MLSGEKFPQNARECWLRKVFRRVLSCNTQSKGDLIEILEKITKRNKNSKLR